MAYRRAKALDRLVHQVNEKFPGRSTVSDGWIGDAAHSARTSDHNPNDRGIVCAQDLTNDPAHSLLSENLAEGLRVARDPRIKYVISNRKIFAGNAGPKPWVWRKYTGTNPHNHHVHISVLEDHADNESNWNLSKVVTPAGKYQPQPERPVIKRGANGEAVAVLQRLLNATGAGLKVDGNFGSMTDEAVRNFQTVHGLHPDGVVGPYTWEQLEKR
jgi:hypothetical protein